MSSKEQQLENSIKASQGAQLFLQDLQELLRSSDSLTAMLVLPQIEIVAGVKSRLDQIVSALQSNE